MAITKQQKVLMGLLGLGAVALILDRVVVGYDATGPSSAAAGIVDVAAQAGDEPGTTQTAAPDATTLASTAPPAVVRNVIAEKLAALGESQGYASADLVDAFEPSASWMPSEEPASNPETEPVDRLPSATEVFLARHTLDAVITNGTQGVAVIDGKAITPGHRLEPDGVLLRVAERSAVFLVNGTEVELKLADATSH